jgi:hypothetical protein
LKCILKKWDNVNLSCKSELKQSNGIKQIEWEEGRKKERKKESIAEDS